MLSSGKLAHIESLAKQIETAREHFNSLCAEIHQEGVAVSMWVHAVDTTMLGDTRKRSYQTVQVDLSLPIN